MVPGQAFRWRRRRYARRTRQGRVLRWLRFPTTITPPGGRRYERHAYNVLAHTFSPVDYASCGGLVGTEQARYCGGSGRRHPGRSGPQLPQARDLEVYRPPSPAEWRSGRVSRRARASSAASDWRRRRSAACHRPDPDGDGLSVVRQDSTLMVDIQGERARCDRSARRSSGPGMNEDVCMAISVDDPPRRAQIVTAFLRDSKRLCVS
jgi:hypothetical protein